MNENNELSDIVLNKNSNSNSSKKMVLAIATLGIILIAVVLVMKSCGSEEINSAPQAVIPPQPQQIINQEKVDEQPAQQEPLFEEVEVVEDNSNIDDADLDKIAQKLKEESQQEEPVNNVVETKPITKVEQPKVEAVKRAAVKQVVQTPKSSISYYVQVGSFTKYEPNKKFLSSITKLGYKYMYNKVNVNGRSINKVLVGPFASESQARDARRVLRSKVEPGAFLVKLK